MGAEDKPCLVSGCLLGRACRYDGADRRDDALCARLGSRSIDICPEEAGGLGTPRVPAQFDGGDGEAVWQGSAQVIDEDGVDRTQAFCRGAARCLAKAIALGCDEAFLKEGSPSCGTSLVRVNSQKQAGLGVTAALFVRAGLRVHGA